MRSEPSSIGVDAIAIAVPRSFLDLADLAAARGVAPGKYQQGLGCHRMSIAGPDEDPVTLGATAARRLLQSAGVRPEEVGMCVVGTETAVDHAKPVAIFLHGLLGLASTCRVFEIKHACFGGTAGLLSAAEWIASGAARGRAALVVCTDIARYALGSAGEPTQGAGAVAMLVRERPRLLELEVGRTGAYARDVWDFWRPLHHKDALVDGQFSVQCYLDALTGAYQAFRALEEGGEEALARTCYHVPYGKMARKAHRARRMLDGLTEAEADATFDAEVGPSLGFSAEVGNVYTASLYMSLASLLDAEAATLAGRRIGLFSYGSGCAAEFFAGRVQPDAAAFVRALDLAAPLRDRRRLTVDEYEALRRADPLADRRPAPAETAPISAAQGEGTPRYLGIDERERRVYLDA
jgi:hydroxymethylglutaryl-CoA synthase